MKRLVILGAGESGAGTAVLGLKKGYEVFVSDMGSIKPQYKALMDEYGVPYEEGKHTPELILNATEVVKSPGIPLSAPLVKQLIDNGTPVLSEIEFAARYTPAKFICITGSNGKTTTTSLIYDILSKAGYDVGLAGNIGKSLALQVALEDKKYYVVELSSFQLDNMYEFKADIAVLMNITPDHMDRYDYCFQNYVNAKMRITQNQQEQDAFIYWSEDPVTTKELRERPIGASIYAFGNNSSNAARIVADKVQIHANRADLLELPLNALSLKGVHNAYNSMAAALAAQLAGVPNTVIENSLRTFAGVEHRLQFFAEKRCVRWVNDSKATNVDSCYYALGAMTTPTVLILGGKDKGNDYSQIDELVREKCHTLVFMGLHNEPLHEHFDGFLNHEGLPIQIIDTNNLTSAIEACQRAAKPGDTVLLSPCCASFDLFTSYEDRGHQFMDAVNAL